MQLQGQNLNKFNRSGRFIQQNFIFEIGLNEGFWTAGTCLSTEPVFYWMGHSKPITYSDWNRGEPNNSKGDEDCIELRYFEGFTWNDVPCNRKLYTLCEESTSKRFK